MNKKNIGRRNKGKGKGQEAVAGQKRKVAEGGDQGAGAPKKASKGAPAEANASAEVEGTGSASSAGAAQEQAAEVDTLSQRLAEQARGEFRPRKFVLDIYWATKTESLQTAAPKPGKLLATLNFDDNGSKPPDDFTALEKQIRAALPAEITEQKAVDEGWTAGELEAKKDGVLLCMKMGWEGKGADLENLDKTCDSTGEAFHKSIFRPWDPKTKRHFERGTYEVGDEVEVFALDDDEGEGGRGDEDGVDVKGEWWEGICQGVSKEGDKVQIQWETKEGVEDEEYWEWVQNNARVRHRGSNEVFKCSVFLEITT